MAWSYSSAALAISTESFVQIFVSQGIEFFVDSDVFLFKINFKQIFNKFII